MRLDISRISRILPILSILILGGFQTTSALEYLITDSLGGTSQITDKTYQVGDSVAPIQVYVYLKYTKTEVTGMGFTKGSLGFSSSDSTISYLNGTAGSATSQAGVYTVQNAKANGDTGTGWSTITGSLSGNKGLLTSTYATSFPSTGNTFVASGTAYLYLATATLTVNTTNAGVTTIGANSASPAWTSSNSSTYLPTSDSFLITVNAVPEPTTYALAAISCVALGTIGRRKSLKAKNQATA
jgi:hypothetical protein